MKKLKIIFAVIVSLIMGVDMASAKNDNIDTVANNRFACDSYTWDKTGSTYYASAKEEVSINDTLYVLNLTILNTYRGVDTVVRCDQYVWERNHQNYRESVLDTYTVSGNGLNSCDSVFSLMLTINRSTGRDTTVAACESFSWYGENKTNSGEYSHMARNASGCNDTVRLLLTINHHTSSMLDTTVCDRFFWDLNGTTYSTTTTDSWSITNKKGCDSVITLNAQVNYSSNDTVDYQHGCDYYTWGGRTLTEPGSYTHTFYNRFDCDSLVTLHLSIDSSTHYTQNEIACDVYTWVDGVTYRADTSGVRTVIPNRKGCDSTIVLNLTLNHNSSHGTIDTACDSIRWNGVKYSETGNYLYHYTDAYGCSSVDTLHLTINRSSEEIEMITACDNYLWHGSNYTSSTDAVYHDTNAAGCDSVIILRLRINPNTNGTQSVTACDSYTWIDGMTYTADNNSATHRIPNSKGCDSVITLNLTIHQNSGHDTSATVCDEMRWDRTNALYNTSGDYYYRYIDNNNCYSIDTLRLTVNKSTISSFDTTVCDGYSWIDGNRYTTDTIVEYTLRLQNSNNCDSIITLDLTVNYSSTGIEAVVACDDYIWHDSTYIVSTDAPTFLERNVYNCDSIVTLNLIVNYSTSGVQYDTACDSYTWISGDGREYTNSTDAPHWTLENANSFGCDSVVTLNLSIRRSITETRWNDVIAVNNNTEYGKFTSCKWYHNGKIVGEKSYVREDGGLSGKYYVVAITGNGDTITSCEQDFGEKSPNVRIVTATPNPTARYTTLSDGNWNAGELVQICNMQGMVVRTLSAKDDGHVELDMGGLNQGVYMVRIGNEVVKVVKQ